LAVIVGWVVVEWGTGRSGPTLSVPPFFFDEHLDGILEGAADVEPAAAVSLVVVA